MKYLSNTLAALLGLLFVAGSLFYFFGKTPPDPFPAGSPPSLFMGVMMPTGYMTFVKVGELVGGILVAFPRTRNFGLLVLGPICINILCFGIFLMKGVGLANPLTIFITVVPLFLLWVGRARFAALAN